MHYFRKSNVLFYYINQSLMDLPASVNLSHWWNFGSLLGITFIFQIVTGVFISMHYVADTSVAFLSVSHIVQDVNLGWFLRALHANGASAVFIFLYLHMGRGFYYGSFNISPLWATGVGLLFLSMAISFLGYVLPWGQMSFWGATVITNLISAIPFVGLEIVIWLWGGYSVAGPTLNRFFSLHYLLPFLLVFLILLHLLFLHYKKSSNPLGFFSSVDKVPFGPYFQVKDLMAFFFFFILLLFLVSFYPFVFSDAENFMSANPLVAPLHIQPEWYFLFAYAILRSVPNKLGGVVCLFLSISLLWVFCLKTDKIFKTYKLLTFFLLLNFLMLTYLGMKGVEQPFYSFAQLMSFFYFVGLLAFLICFMLGILKMLEKMTLFYKMQS